VCKMCTRATLTYMLCAYVKIVIPLKSLTELYIGEWSYKSMPQCTWSYLKSLTELYIGEWSYKSMPQCTWSYPVAYNWYTWSWLVTHNCCTWSCLVMSNGYVQDGCQLIIELRNVHLNNYSRWVLDEVDCIRA
jgi:hypothetical protein